ncbi:MAG: hypothetical protein H0X29_11825 [Parachlamydiaceae bacterium]|nr:hypothetical protein [Parachlamydiaceae bacterium]
MKKILLIKTSSLGDIIQAYPVLDFLHDKFPKAEIDWVVERPFEELVRAHPKINNVLCVATKEWRCRFYCLSILKEIRDFWRQLRRNNYDVVFDLQGNVKSGLILSQVKSRQKVGFGKKSVPEWPNTFFTNKRFNPPAGGNIREDYLAVVKAFFSDTTPCAVSSPSHSNKVTLKISDIQKAAVQSVLQNVFFEGHLKVVICPGSAWRNKQMTLEALLVFLSGVQEHLRCHFLFLWGSFEEKALVDQLHEHFMRHSLVIDRMSLPMVQNLMMEVDLVIAMDSLPLHLAGTTLTPSFSIFGPSLAQKYKPIGPQHFAFQGACPYGSIFEKRCPILRTCPTGACIRELAGDGELIIKFRNWWDSYNRDNCKGKF